MSIHQFRARGMITVASLKENIIEQIICLTNTRPVSLVGRTRVCNFEVKIVFEILK